MRTEFILEAIAAVNEAVLNSEAELESLDREIGDGDHFINLKRGCTTLLAMRDELAPLPHADAGEKTMLDTMILVGTLSAASQQRTPTRSRHSTPSSRP